MTRWLVIATVHATPWLFTRGWSGSPGFWLNWRGRCDWCQPNEFLNWDQIERAVRTRLRVAGLAPVSFACRPPRQEYQALWVEVERCPPRR